MTRDRDPASHAGFGADLRIDWVPGRMLGGGGADVGLVGLPGKHGPSQRYPGRTYRREVDDDLAALRNADVRTLILLVEDAELRRWSQPDLVERAARLGVEVRRHPIPDGQAPATVGEMEAILADLERGRARGRVAVACMGGVGRSGTVVACALVRNGQEPDEAIALVRSIRHPTAIETPAQEAFVRDFARRDPLPASSGDIRE